MSPLADSFPDHHKKEFSERNLRPATVIKLFDPRAKKEKWHIIIGFNEDKIITATVRINSLKNKNVFRTPQLNKLCHHIKLENNPFLEWDSFVDCSFIIEWRSEELLKIIAKHPGCVKGSMNDREFDSVRSIISIAETISSKQKRKFGII